MQSDLNMQVLSMHSTYEPSPHTIHLHLGPCVRHNYACVKNKDVCLKN